MKYLFYLPSCQLSIYLISHFLYQIREKSYEHEIYILLEKNPFLTIDQTWYDMIHQYDLEYLYKTHYTNLFIFNEEFCKEEMYEKFQKSMDVIFTVAPDFMEWTDEIKNKYIKMKKRFEISNQKIVILLPCNVISSKYLKQKIWKEWKKKDHIYFYFYHFYFGEDERGILQNHPFSQNYFNIYLQSLTNHSFSQDLSFLLLDSLSYLSKYLINILFHIHQISSRHNLFLNQFETSSLFPPFSSPKPFNPTISFLKDYIQSSHSNFYSFYNKSSISKIIYHQPISFDIYLSKNHYHHKDSPIPKNKSLDFVSSLGAFYSLNIISISCLLLIPCYLFLQNKKLILLPFLILLWKIPHVFDKLKEYLKKTISSIFEYYSGRVYVEDVDSIEDEKSYIYLWNPHKIIPLGSFLSICSEEFREKMKEKKKIYNVCHDLVFYFPILSTCLDIFDFQTCKKTQIEDILHKDQSVGLWLGGVKEMNIKHHEWEDYVYVLERKGIFQIAIEKGIDIIPTYTFGEVNTYENEFEIWNHVIGGYSVAIPSIKTITNEFMNLFKVFREKPDYYTVIGKPIQVMKKEKAELDDIHELKMKYIESLEELYMKYRNVRYSFPRNLRIL